jgi:hypothetical protein
MTTKEKLVGRSIQRERKKEGRRRVGKENLTMYVKLEDDAKNQYYHHHLREPKYQWQR